MILLHFPLDALLDRRRSRKTLADLAESGAGLFIIAQHRQRLTETKHALGRLRRFGVIGGQLQILLSGLARPRALEIGLAKKERRLWNQLAARIVSQKGAQLRLGLFILAAVIGVDRGVQLLSWTIGRLPANSGDDVRLG